MRTTVAALALSILVAATAVADIHGAWTAESEPSGKMQLNLTTHRSNHGETVNPADFAGLSPAAMNATAQTPVEFELRREAGTIAFQGTFKDGFGAGQFTFKPNPDFFAAMRTLGVTFNGDEPMSDDNLLTMTLLDVSSGFIRSLQAEGYHETGNKYVEMRIFNVTPEYIHDMRAAGYPDLTAQQLVESRIHKVTPEFIKSVKDAGYDHVPFRKLVEMRIHGIDADYIKRMNAAK